MLGRDVGAQPHGGQDIQAFNIVAGTVASASEDHPAAAEAGHPICLGETAEADDEHVVGQGRHGDVDGVVVDDFVVDLIRVDDEVVAAGQLDDAFQDLATVDGAGGVVRV